MFSICYMDDDTRRQAFRAYFKRRWGEDEEASQAKAATDLDLSEGRISQILNAVGPFGERAARALARRCGLDESAFLGATNVQTLGARRDASDIEAIERLLQVARRLDEDDRAVLGGMLLGLVKAPDNAVKRQAILEQLERWSAPAAPTEDRRASGGG